MSKRCNSSIHTLRSLPRISVSHRFGTKSSYAIFDEPTCMFESLKQLTRLALQSKKVWLFPIALSLVIVALLVMAAYSTPIPLFLYPLV